MCIFQQYGQADHSITHSLLLRKFKDYDQITWSNEGYWGHSMVVTVTIFFFLWCSGSLLLLLLSIFWSSLDATIAAARRITAYSESEEGSVMVRLRDVTDVTYHVIWHCGFYYSLISCFTVNFILLKLMWTSSWPVIWHSRYVVCHLNTF